MKEFEQKYPYFWLLLGLVLTMFSYGIFNTGICAWIFAIPLIRFIKTRTRIPLALAMGRKCTTLLFTFPLLKFLHMFNIGVL